MAVLKGMSTVLKGRSIDLNMNELTIGRNPENGLPIDDPTVSGKHCRIVREDEQFRLIDLNSTNGTRVNSRDISETILKPKDIVQVGSVEFMFDSEHAGSIDSTRLTKAQVEEAEGPSAAPDSFGNISPFGARRKESKGPWFLLIALIGVLALAALVFFLYKLFMAT
ncbi:MAG: FHA domain-containing protein [Verrucomicrobia bacterium]|nr:FHA domain-containing protein [Verrucomicrobiota bacterium]